MSASELSSLVPSGQPTTPEKIASLCVYLISDAARQLTAQEIVMDGGTSVGRGFAAYPGR